MDSLGTDFTPSASQLKPGPSVRALRTVSCKFTNGGTQGATLPHPMLCYPVCMEKEAWPELCA